jgi:hypothetical protein
MGERPSYAWSSRLSACDVQKNGLVWRVGDGQDIWIWSDKWIPTPISFSI